MNEPLVFAFPGVKVAKLTDYPYFSGRKVLLSVGYVDQKHLTKI